MRMFPTNRGVTVTEIAPMDRPIGAFAETTAAFVGRALRGPLDTPVEVTSFADFRRRFGGLWHRSSLGPAVLQFFEHGGRRLYVVRVANNARGALLCIPAPQGVLALRASEPGSTERIRAAVDYDGLHPSDTEHFNLTLQRIAPDTGLVVEQEIYRRVSCDEADRRCIAGELAGSELVRLQMPLPAERPLPTTDPRNRFAPGYVGHVQPGTDGSALSDYDLIGCAAEGTGIFALEGIEHLDLLYLPPPGRQREVGPAATLAAELYCRKRGALLILDPPAAWDTPAAAIAGTRNGGFASANVVSYWPRVRHRDEDAARPAGGALAGLLCKLDRNYGPWEDLDHRTLGLRRHLVPAAEATPEEAAMLVKEGLNVITCEDPSPASFRGGVTLARNSGIDRTCSSLAARRLCLAITNAIGEGTRWAVFERGKPRVGERVQAQVQAYLSALAGAGAFANDSFEVACSAPLSTDDPHAGITIMLSFRPLRTRDLVSLTLHQTVAGCRVASTAFAPAVPRCA